MTITPEMIARINELAAKKKAEGLTEGEQAEQKALYKEYLAAIRGQVRQKLDNVRYVEDLTEEELKEELANRTKEV
ncbi:MAG: DUF896 domain-containing protein [Firmicutes bacterium]|nr:DUF896 domain-containing protein [Bacillota bacterium]